MLTRRGRLGHDVADVVLGARAKHVPQALRSLLALVAQTVASIGGLLAMADKVHCRLAGGGEASQDEDGGQSHGVPIWVIASVWGKSWQGGRHDLLYMQ